VASHTDATPETATERADPAYLDAHTHFISYHQHVLTIKAACDAYAQHYFGLFSSSHTIVHTITLAAINDAITTTTVPSNIKNGFTALRDRHAVLQGDKEQAVAIALNDHVIKPISDALATHDRINKTIEQRNELAKELDYYAGKVNHLIAEQHEQASKHKDVSAKEVEKLARNQKKKDETASMFAVVNTQLVGEMETIVKDREELLLGIINEFEKIEQQVLELYTGAVSNEGHEPGSVSANRSRTNSLKSNIVVPGIDGHINNNAAAAAAAVAAASTINRSRSPARPGSSSPAPPAHAAQPPPPPYNPTAKV